MVTGRRRFEGRTRGDLDVAIARDDPEPPSRIEPLTPADVEGIVLRCLRKDPEGRYASGAELLQDLERVGAADPDDGAPAVRRRVALALMVGGLLIGALMVWLLGDRVTSTPRAPPSGMPTEVSPP